MGRAPLPRVWSSDPIRTVDRWKGQEGDSSSGRAENWSRRNT